ncbi:helix-turn-helix domain-containing protein [Nonomuraea sp. B12E4]|uniref:helix-turn-helix domain-containing protein n=1 Tax=Nonomuraea sp. B12E4 TaxID=3153564 RepID=UPI00325D1570
MKPSTADEPTRTVPSPTAPPCVRRPLLRLAAKGVSTADAAEKLGLPALTVWRYLERLRVAGDVALRPTDDGRGAEWWKTTKSRRSA